MIRQKHIVLLLAVTSGMMGCMDTPNEQRAPSIDPVGFIFDWHATAEDVEKNIAYIDWNAEVIYIADGKRTSVAARRGVEDPSQENWVIQNPDGVTVTAKVVELPLGTALRADKNSLLSVECEDRECQAVPARTEACLAFSGGSYKTTIDAHQECTFVIVGQDCTANWKKIGNVQFYTLPGCIAGTENGAPRDKKGWDCS